VHSAKGLLAGAPAPSFFMDIKVLPGRCYKQFWSLIGQLDAPLDLITCLYELATTLQFAFLFQVLSFVCFEFISAAAEI
jgi:hypothetical protein